LYSPVTTPLLSYLNLLPSYTPLETTIHLQKGTPEEIHKLLYRYEKNSFETVIIDNDASFHDMTWVEDVELGRGFLLLSDSASSGKVWRYETGGGLIPIGKSLFLDQSGCRSGHWTSCDDDSGMNGGSGSGSKGMAVQVVRDEDRFDIGRLIIVEGGEKRIVRLEEDGARTPLVLNVPSLCATGGHDAHAHARVNRPGHVVYSPFGDLLFTETMDCRRDDDPDVGSSSTTRSGIYRVKEVVNIPAITFQQSRDAHAWSFEDMVKQQHSEASSPVELAYNGMQHISDLMVGKDLTSLFVAGVISSSEKGCRQVIVKMTDDGDAGAGATTETETVKKLDEMQVFLDMTEFFPNETCTEVGIAMTMDSSGNTYATYPGGVAIIDPEGNLLVTVSVSVAMNDADGEPIDIQPNGIIIGNDGYLYLTTKDMLLRWRIKSKLLDYPTNLIVPKKK